MAEWQRPPQALSAEPGSHRFVWDVRYDPLEGGGGGRGGLSMAAIWHDTPAGPSGPWVPPGEYVVKLTVNGQSSGGVGDFSRQSSGYSGASDRFDISVSGGVSHLDLRTG